MNKIPSNAKGGANPSIGSSNVAANNGPVTAGMDSAQRALRSGARVQLQQSLVRPAGQYTQYTHPKGYLQQHFAASNVPVDYRLLRLKAEFINMLLLIPPYLVNYRDSLELIMTQRSPHQYLKNFAERLLEDEFRSSTETFISSIQSAASPQELLDCIVFFSKSLHRSVLMNFNEDFLPRSANCTATAAVYLYALDRALRYEDIISLNLPSVGKYKPRVQYCPRCLLSSTCSKPWGHGGRCSPGFENQFSRFIEISHEAPELRTHLVAPVFTVPAPLQFNTVPVYHATSAAAVRDPARFGTQYKRPLDSNIPNQGAQDGSRKLPADLTNYASLADVEVENITPYVPRAHELSSIIWV